MKQWFLSHRGWCMGILRAYLGIGLMVKAVNFIANREALLQQLEENDIVFLGAGLAHFIILTHVFGGALMAVGFATRIGALIQIPNLIGAVVFVHMSGGIFAIGEELRFTMLVLLLLVLFVWYGSGRLSVDSYMASRSPD